MSRGPWNDHFPDNFLWSNATLILKGMAPYGVVSLEEMDRCCEKLRARQGGGELGGTQAAGAQVADGEEGVVGGHGVSLGAVTRRRPWCPPRDGPRVPAEAQTAQ